MTEAEWLSCSDPRPMLRSQQGRAGSRKLRLACCAFCRRVWHLMTDRRSRRAVEIAESFADGRASLRDLESAKETAEVYLLSLPRTFSGGYFAAVAAVNAAYVGEADSYSEAVVAYAASVGTAYAATAGFSDNAQMGEEARLVRDIIGNPFRLTPTIDPAWLSWDDGIVVNLARRIYDGRPLDLMPVLGDVLENAGCTDPDLLGHLRGPGPHVRGCWALDLVLGRE